jgi:hypothetical protein
MFNLNIYPWIYLSHFWIFACNFYTLFLCIFWKICLQKIYAWLVWNFLNLHEISDLFQFFASFCLNLEFLFYFFPRAIPQIIFKTLHFFTRIAKTFCLSNYGHGMYLSSPSEIQKFTISTDFLWVYLKIWWKFCSNLYKIL